MSVFVDDQKKDQTANVRTQLGDPVNISFDLKQAAAQQQTAQAVAGAGAAPAPEQERGLSKDQKEALEKQRKENEATMAKNKALNDTFNAGKDALAAKNYDAAIDAFQKGVEMDANQNVIWANLADAYVGQAASKTGADQQASLEALEAYSKAIALKPENAAYHNNYALTLAKAKKFDEAQTELNKAAQLDPPQAGRYYYNLGAVYVNNGQPAAAEVAFKKSIEVNPDYADAQFQYATALSAKLATGADGKVVAPDGMKDALEKYLSLEPTGQFADAAKGMLQMIGATIQTNYQNPDGKKTPPKKKPASNN